MNISKELTIGGVLTVLFLGIVIYLMAASNSTYTQLINPISTYPTPSLVTKNATGSTYSLAEVAKHNSQTDCWLIINGNVYNATNYLFDHPGGAQNIIAYCGTDATVAYEGMRKHSSVRAQTDLSSLLIGAVK